MITLERWGKCCSLVIVLLEDIFSITLWLRGGPVSLVSSNTVLVVIAVLLTVRVFTGFVVTVVREVDAGGSVVVTAILVVIADSDYADIHNSGGTIEVTARMKRYFWA